MKIDRVLELLKIERECVTRQSPCNEKSKLCDRNCGECDIAQDDLEIIEMYDFVIGMLEMQTERRFTPYEVGLAMVAAGQNDIRFKWGETIRYSPSEVEKILSATEDVGCLIVER